VLSALDPDTLTALVQATTAPLNVLAIPSCPEIATLQALGVRRLSQKSGPARAMLGLARRVARELLDGGRYTPFHQGSIGYTQANTLFADPSTAPSKLKDAEEGSSCANASSLIPCPGVGRRRIADLGVRTAPDTSSCHSDSRAGC
jgi:hypothetical protein